MPTSNHISIARSRISIGSSAAAGNVGKASFSLLDRLKRLPHRITAVFSSSSPKSSEIQNIPASSLSPSIKDSQESVPLTESSEAGTDSTKSISLSSKGSTAAEAKEVEAAEAAEAQVQTTNFEKETHVQTAESKIDTTTASATLDSEEKQENNSNSDFGYWRDRILSQSKGLLERVHWLELRMDRANRDISQHVWSLSDSSGSFASSKHRHVK